MADPPHDSRPPPADGPTSASAEDHARAGAELERAGRFGEAAARYRLAVRLRPDNADYRFRLAVTTWRVEGSAGVGAHLREAARLAPHDARVHEALGQWYFEAGDVSRALAHAAAARDLAPGDARVAISLAIVLEGAGRTDEAWALVQSLLRAGGPPAPRLALAYARLAPAVGQEAQALSLVQELIGSPSVGPQAKATLRFAAAMLLDRAGRYDEAFEAARLGKHATRRPYDPDVFTRRIDYWVRYFTPDKFAALPRADHGSRRPIFIVGMPRSGTSLVEQILASHPAVHAAGELATLSEVLVDTSRCDWAGGAPYPLYLDRMTVKAANGRAAAYLDELRRLNESAPHVTDKMPLNFLYVGLIALLFPECGIVHCTREPLDTCVSCFMTHFANGIEFSHDLTHLGRYYRDYARLMDHWRDALHVPLIEVKYEDVVNDLEGQTRRLLDSLGLPWDERCLAFHRTGRPVPTASSAQVRRPLYATSVNRWVHYRGHLNELVAALGR